MRKLKSQGQRNTYGLAVIQHGDRIDKIFDDRIMRGNKVAKLISKFNAHRSAMAICTFAATAMVFSILCGAAFAQNDGPIVKTAGGKLRGVATPNGGARFLGIPYAQPPVGDLRWREPKPVAAWGAESESFFGGLH